MSRFKGFNASVVVDGVDLSEYEETGSETTTADGVPQKTVYIESQTGRRFMLRFKSDFAGTFRVRTWIDGQQLNCSVISRGDEHVKKGRLQGSGALAERQPLVFAPLKLVSDLDGVRADALFEEQKNGNVKAGQIKLEFWDYAVLGREAVKDKVPRKQAAQIEVHEKAKKGAFLSHTSDFGAAIPEPQRSTHSQGYVTGTFPRATIVFEYRSKILLETMGFTVLPFPTGPSIPIALARAGGSSSGAYLAAPAPPRPALNVAPAPAVKRENPNVDGTAVKEEPAKKLTVENVGGVLTIDLTDD